MELYTKKYTQIQTRDQGVMQPVKCISRFDIFWMEPSTLRWISTRNHWLETGSSAQDIVQLSSLQNHGFNSSIGSNENIVSWTVVKKSDWIYVYAARHWYGFSIPFKLNRNTFVFLPPEISCQHTLPEGGFVTAVRSVNLYRRPISTRALVSEMTSFAKTCIVRN